MSAKTEYRVQHTAEQLMEHVTDVRDRTAKTAEAMQYTGEFDTTRTIAKWVDERLRGIGGWSPEAFEAKAAYINALVKVVIHAPFSSTLYHEAGFELLGELVEIEGAA